MEDRKKKLVENKENRDFHLMNPGVPITFPLPFNCIEWRYMKINFIMVRLLVEGFMVEYNMSLDKRGLQALKDQSISEKIITINKLTKDLVYSQPDYLRRNFVYNTLKEFEDANKEFIDCMGETEYGVMDGDYPTLLTTIDSSGNSICVIVG